MRDLTPRQAAILDFIRAQLHANGYQPSVREIGREFGINSPNGVCCHLKALERKGYIQLADGRARGIVLMERSAVDYLAEGKRLIPSEREDLRGKVQEVIEALLR